MTTCSKISEDIALKYPLRSFQLSLKQYRFLLVNSGASGCVILYETYIIMKWLWQNMAVIIFLRKKIHCFLLPLIGASIFIPILLFSLSNLSVYLHSRGQIAWQMHSAHTRLMYGVRLFNTVAQC